MTVPLVVTRRMTDFPADSHTIDRYEATGGYRQAKRACSMTRDGLVEDIKQCGLLGRGGAAFSAGLKWSFLAPARPAYLVINGDESEPGTFKDRLLMEKDPHLCIESFVISAFAMKANTTYIYIRGEYVYATRVLEKAIAEAYAKGYLGKNILGSGFDHDMVVHRGAGAYICGEETALMTSLEGNRGLPRLPSSESSRPVSSPQMYAPAPRETCSDRLKPEPRMSSPR